MSLETYVNQNPEGVQDNPITEPVAPITPVTEPVAPAEPAAPVVDKPVETTPAIEEIDINGTKVPITELKQGYLRQSDYTRKTQELSQQRQEAKDALELVEYLRANPEIAKRLVEDQAAAPLTKTNPTVNALDNPMRQELDGIKQQLIVNQIDADINRLKAVHPDFDEVAVLNKATELKTNDLEFVYNALRGQNLDAIIQTKIQEALANATSQAQKEGVISKTLISGKDTDKPDTITLSDQQKRMADKLGMSYEEYQKWS